MSGWRDVGAKGERDRAEARKPRYGGSRIESFDHLVKGFLKDEEVARMRRFARVRSTLDRILPATMATRVNPLRMQQGALTLQVSDTILASELRSHYAGPLLAALAEDRTGVTRLIWRV